MNKIILLFHHQSEWSAGLFNLALVNKSIRQHCPPGSSQVVVGVEDSSRSVDCVARRTLK